MTSNDLAAALNALPSLRERTPHKTFLSDGMVAEWFKPEHREFLLAWSRHFGFTLRLPTSLKNFELAVRLAKECRATNGCRIGVKAYPFRADSGWHLSDGKTHPPPTDRYRSWDDHRAAWFNWISHLNAVGIVPDYWLVENEWPDKHPGGRKMAYSTNDPQWATAINECWREFTMILRGYAANPIYSYGRYVDGGMFQVPGEGADDVSQCLYETWGALATRRRMDSLNHSAMDFPVSRRPPLTGWVAMCQGYHHKKQWSNAENTDSSWHVGHDTATGCVQDARRCYMLDVAIPYGLPEVFGVAASELATSADILAFVCGAVGLPLE